MEYKSVGSTTHYSISYDTALSKADGENRANALKAKCEQDFTLMAGWFAGVTLTVLTPIEVQIQVGPGSSASWGDLRRSHIPRPYGLGYTPGGIAHLWLNEKSRPDWVNHTDPDRKANEKSGCSLLFLWYLNAQLGFDINSIVAAAAPTLAGVYKNLRDMVDPFPDFKQVLDSAFPATNPDGSPRTSAVPGRNPDNPFPLPSPRTLSVKRYIAALPPVQRTGSIRSLIAKSGRHTLRPTLNTNRRAAFL
jgi:hypothetical protein